MTTTYRLELAQRATTGLGAAVISNVLTLGHPQDESDRVFSWGETLNGAGSVSFSLPIDGSGVTEANFYPGRELHLYRDVGAGEVLVWGGHLWSAEVESRLVRFMGFGWYEYFRHRQMRDDFFRNQYEQLDGVWEMIAYAQTKTNGNIGITRGSTTASGTLRDFQYCAEETQIIADAIEEFSGGDDGFDFRISPDKVWRTFTPKKGTDLTATVVLNAATNVEGLSYTWDGTQIENDVAGVGPAEECEPIHMTTAVNLTSQAKHGLLESSLQRDKPGQDLNLLDALANERVDLYGWPLRQPTVAVNSELSSKLPVTDYVVGDTVTLAASWGFATFSAPYRVTAFSIDVDAVNREFVDVTVDAAV